MAYTEHTHCPNCFQPSYKSVCAACFFERDTYLRQEAASHHLPLFTQLDKGYTLGRVLGEGSFAIVYAAIRDKDQLACAVKEYYPQDLAQRGLDGKTVNPKRNQKQLASWQNRFIQEGELLRCCYDYPSVESGVVRYMGLVKQHGTAYLVMERLPGDTLGHYLAKNPILSGSNICVWLKPLLETLQKLHAKEIYHRDISPNNIFLCAPNNPVLMDFGLAREGARDEVLKSSTLGAGTFIAPEQLTGGYCDQRTDLYALGAVIYLCLHGEVPPPVESRRQGAPLRRLAQPDTISLALQTVSTHCLQLDLQMRPKNAAQLLADLAHCWSNQPSQSNPSLRTIIPDQSYPQPAISERVSANANVLPTPHVIPNPIPAPPPPPPASGSFFKSTVKLLIAAGLVYAGLVGYENYTTEQEKNSKQERQLFAKAHSLEDFQAYLAQCQICEAKQEAEEKIAEFEKAQQVKTLQKQQKKQEHLAYIQAQSIEDLNAYLLNCEFCLDKKKAEKELKKLLAEKKAKEEAQAASVPSLFDSITDAASPNPDSPPALPDAEQNPNADAEAKAQSDAELLKSQEEADQRAKAEAELKAELDAEAKAQNAAKEKLKADAGAVLKSEVQSAIKKSTGIDVKAIEDWLNTTKK